MAVLARLIQVVHRLRLKRNFLNSGLCASLLMDIGITVGIVTRRMRTSAEFADPGLCIGSVGMLWTSWTWRLLRASHPR